MYCAFLFVFFFFKQKTAYEMRISDWSSDVCSSDLFAQLYADLAEQISAKLENRTADPASLLVPTVEDGARGVAFIAAAVESSRRDAAWTELRLDQIGRSSCRGRVCQDV